MQDFKFIIAAIMAALLGYLLFKKAMASKQKQSQSLVMFQDIMPLFQGAQIAAGESTGSWKMTGYYRSHFFQIQTIIDMLATRKLPSLWLMITLPQPQPVQATLDLMMRPTGPTSFSNFDFLDTTLKTPESFPEQAVIRTDDPAMMHHVEKLGPYLEQFRGPRGKELLVSPKGLRIVLLAAEADRARYGVFRDANFGAIILDAVAIRQSLDTLLSLQDSLKAHDAA
jgi:hypothetical protein